MGWPMALLVHVPFFQVKNIQYESQIKSKIKKKKYNKIKITTQVKCVKQPIWRKSEKKK